MENQNRMGVERPEPENMTAPPPTAEKEVVVKCDRLNVRTNPNVNSEILGIVTRGTRLKAIKHTQEWVEVMSVYGHGYVMKKFTEVI